MRINKILLLVIIGILVMGLLGGFFLALGLYNVKKGGQLDKATGTLPTGTGCFLGDQYFTDTSLADDIEGTIAAIVGKYPSAKGKEQFFREILQKGKEKGINPAIPIGIWWGEQEFLSPDKAFGQGNYDNGDDVIVGWPAELEGVYRTIKKAIDNVKPYTAPAGTNRMTRLFYNYATAMGDQYRAGGGNWDSNYKHPKHGNPYYKRLNVIKFLVPSQIECEDRSLAGDPSSGSYGCPVDANVAKRAARGGWGDVRAKRSYKVGTYPGHEGYDLMSAVGTKVYSVSDGMVTKVKVDNDGDGQSSTSVTIKEKDGVYWYYTHLQEPVAKEGEAVRRGDKIAEVGQYVRNSNGKAVHHLHIGIHNGSKDTFTNGPIYRWISTGGAWYYPYIFLRHIPCLEPPDASEVSYP